MKKTIFTAAVLAFCSAAAYANTISVTAVNGNLYQQTVQSPCVFSNPSCTNGSFNVAPLPTGGGVSGYDSFSPVYTGSTIFGIIGAGNSIELGLDINQATGQPAQTLSAFYMLKNGSVVDTFTGSANNVPAGNNRDDCFFRLPTCELLVVPVD